MKKKGKMEGVDDTLTNTTIEALLKFIADHKGECFLAMDEAKRFMKMLVGEYSTGKESSARETFMEFLVSTAALPPPLPSPLRTTDTCLPTRPISLALSPCPD